MTLGHRLTRWAALLATMLLLAAFVVACNGDDDDDANGDDGGQTPSGGQTTTPGGQNLGSVSMLGIWGAEELTSFDKMIAPWQQETGGQVDFTGTRNITADLVLRVEGGNPPDIAAPAEIGLFQQFAREGKLISLDQCEGLEDTIRDNYPEAFVDLGTVDGKLYGFFMKANTKGTIWYNPKFFDEKGIEVPDLESFEDLVEFSEEVREKGGVPPWSIGLESAEASGWPASDWIQQIILNEFGEELYDGLIDGSIPFTDDRVKQAFEMFGEIATDPQMTVQGGAAGINATNFIDSTYPPFESPPTAAMVALGGFASGFITDQFPSAKPGEDFNFFTWPGGGITGDGNIVYAFNDEEATCSLMSYLATAEAQQIWVEEGGFTSLNSEVEMDAYPSDLARDQAKQLLEADTFRFDLDDAIGGALQQALFQGLTEYIANPGSLDSILQQIEGARE